MPMENLDPLFKIHVREFLNSFLQYTAVTLEKSVLLKLKKKTNKNCSRNSSQNNGKLYTKFLLRIPTCYVLETKKMYIFLRRLNHRVLVKS